MNNNDPKIEEFLDEICCIKYGFCIRMDRRDSLLNSNLFDLDDFIHRLFLLDGVNPDNNQEMLLEMKKEFVFFYRGVKK